MKRKNIKTVLLCLSFFFVLNATSYSKEINSSGEVASAQVISDTIIMSVPISYDFPAGSGSGGNWGGPSTYNLSFDQNRAMPPGDQMYVEIETYSNCCGASSWHKLAYGSNTENWYNDLVNNSFTGSSSGTIHTSIDIGGSSSSVASIYIRFVYISATGNHTVYAGVNNARYDLAPTHLQYISTSVNGSSCEKPFAISFQLHTSCMQCDGGSSDDMHIFADFGDGQDTFYTAITTFYTTFNLNHIYTTYGNFKAVFRISNSYGSGRDSLYITVNRKPPADITASSLTFCEGDHVLLNAAIQPNYSYQWKKGGVDIPGATALSYEASAGGNYKVTVTDNLTGCSRTSAPSTSLTMNPKPAAAVIPLGPTTFCTGDNVVLKANAGQGLTYKWKKDGAFISGANAINYTVFAAGNYKVQVTNNNGCKKTSPSVLITVPCRENNQLTERSAEASVFPNPTTGVFTLHADKELNYFIITTITGKTVFKNNVAIKEDENVLIDFSGQPKGVYLLQGVADNEVINQKIVLQ